MVKNNVDRQYFDLLKHILKNGKFKKDRTGTGTISVFPSNLKSSKLGGLAELLKSVWGEKYEKETNYLRLYLSQLRKKLESTPKKPELLITEAGAGYRVIATKLG